MRFPKKIISYGRPGAEQVGLHAALDAGLQIAGHAGVGSAQRKNVLDSEGTLCFTFGRPLTKQSRIALYPALEEALQLGKPVLWVNPRDRTRIGLVRIWLVQNRIDTLNVVGSRESTEPGIHWSVYGFLASVLDHEMPPADLQEWILTHPYGGPATLDVLKTASVALRSHPLEASWHWSPTHGWLVGANNFSPPDLLEAVNAREGGTALSSLDRDVLLIFFQPQK